MTIDFMRNHRDLFPIEVRSRQVKELTTHYGPPISVLETDRAILAFNKMVCIYSSFKIICFRIITISQGLQL